MVAKGQSWKKMGVEDRERLCLLVLKHRSVHRLSKQIDVTEHVIWSAVHGTRMQHAKRMRLLRAMEAEEGRTVPLEIEVVES